MGDSKDKQPRFRQGLDAIKDAIQEEEMGVRLEAEALRHERGEARSADWIEAKCKVALDGVVNESISAGDALLLIAAAVGYEFEPE